MDLEEPMAVLENNGSVEVCAIIKDQDGKPCSREAPFNITFSTEFDSAGGLNHNSQENCA